MKFEDIKEGDTISIKDWNESVYPEIAKTHYISSNYTSDGIERTVTTAFYYSEEEKRMKQLPVDQQKKIKFVTK